MDKIFPLVIKHIILTLDDEHLNRLLNVIKIKGQGITRITTMTSKHVRKQTIIGLFKEQNEKKILNYIERRGFHDILENINFNFSKLNIANLTEYSNFLNANTQLLGPEIFIFLLETRGQEYLPAFIGNKENFFSYESKLKERIYQDQNSTENNNYYSRPFENTKDFDISINEEQKLIEDLKQEISNLNSKISSLDMTILKHKNLKKDQEKEYNKRYQQLQNEKNKEISQLTNRINRLNKNEILQNQIYSKKIEVLENQHKNSFSSIEKMKSDLIKTRSKNNDLLIKINELENKIINLRESNKFKILLLGDPKVKRLCDFEDFYFELCEDKNYNSVNMNNFVSEFRFKQVWVIENLIAYSQLKKIKSEEYNFKIKYFLNTKELLNKLEDY